MELNFAFEILLFKILKIPITILFTSERLFDKIMNKLM